MYIFKKLEDLQEYLDEKRKEGLSIGFIPTMGALHSGHISLINAAKEATDISVCSIFVNPTQFDNQEDLQKYARNLPKDAEMLSIAETNVLFAPSVQEIYPPNLKTEVNIDFGKLTQILEGKFRKGHFEGMVQVVNRFLEIIQPNALFMGQKDFQQAAIVQYMLSEQKSATKLVVCPIVREDNGLAKSSRNERLSAEDRASAKALNEALNQAKLDLELKSILEIKKKAAEHIEKAGFKLEYFEIIDGHSLLNINHIEESNYIVACVAAHLKDARLIDNMILQNKT